MADAILPSPADDGAALADPMTDPLIEALLLSDTAKRCAYALKAQFPVVTFTSGRRDKGDQARAMASNVISNRNWIQETYINDFASAACQQWVNDNPSVTAKADIAAGLLATMNAMTDAQIGQLSKHLSGDAFDVQPVVENAAAIIAAIQALPGLGKFLQKEGGLVRWHAQF